VARQGSKEKIFPADGRFTIDDVIPGNYLGSVYAKANVQTIAHAWNDYGITARDVKMKFSVGPRCDGGKRIIMDAVGFADAVSHK
jgi:hypothetical protein